MSLSVYPSVALCLGAPDPARKSGCQRILEGYRHFRVIHVGSTLMIPSRSVCRRGSLLLATAAIWFIGVTLCSTEALGEDSHRDEPVSKDQHAPAGDHHADGCGCESIQSCSALIYAPGLAKAPMLELIGPVFLSPDLEGFRLEADVVVSRIRNTGPPERSLLAELVIQRAVLSQAPPILT